MQHYQDIDRAAVPLQPVDVKKAFSPQMDSWIGVGLSKFMFYIGYIFIFVAGIFGMLFFGAPFARRWWSLLLYFIFAIPVTVVYVVFAILALRTQTEVILSIFSIRQNLNKIRSL